tara:strand:+ start:4139 stop:5413 length:1275 start_codon:yes stop_codon:yes gene_type:complete
MKKYKLEVLYSLDSIQAIDLEIVVRDCISKFICKDTSLTINESDGVLKFTFVSVESNINSIHQALASDLSDKHSFIRLTDELGNHLRNEAYPILARIEQELRRLIQTAMIENMGFEWWVLVSDSSLVSRVTELEERSSKGVHHHPLEFSEFNHLLDLVTTNIQSWEDTRPLTTNDLISLLDKCKTVSDIRNNISQKIAKRSFWDSVFSHYFEDKKAWSYVKKKISKEIVPIRNKVMHHRPVFKWELNKLKYLEMEINNVLSKKIDSLPKEKSIIVIRNASEMGAEVVKREFLNKELSEEFSVSLQGGIRISRKSRIVFLIYREDGVYKDSKYLSDNGSFTYQGMGMKGNQSFSYFGNRIIKDHVQEGFRLFLFKYSAEKTLNLVGEAFYKSHRIGLAEDYQDNKREVIYFDLKVDKEAKLPSSA